MSRSRFDIWYSLAASRAQRAARSVARLRPGSGPTRAAPFGCARLGPFGCLARAGRRGRARGRRRVAVPCRCGGCGTFILSASRAAGVLLLTSRPRSAAPFARGLAAARLPCRRGRSAPRAAAGAAPLPARPAGLGASPVWPLPLLALGLPVRSPSALLRARALPGAGPSAAFGVARWVGPSLRAGPPAPCGCPRCGSGVLYPSALRASCRPGPPRGAGSWALGRGLRAAAVGRSAPRAPAPRESYERKRRCGRGGTAFAPYCRGGCPGPAATVPRPKGGAATVEAREM